LKKYLPAVVCGFGAGVLNIVPLVKSFSCCMILPVAVIAALILDRKANKDKDIIKPVKAVGIGLLTGIFASFFGTFLETLIVFITRSSDIAAGLPAAKEMMQKVTSGAVSQEMLKLINVMLDDIAVSGFSIFYTFSILMSSLVVNTIMGIVGGLLGMQILNSKINNGDA